MVRIKKQQELDDAIIDAIESGRISFAENSATSRIVISGTLTLEFRVKEDCVAQEAQTYEPHWVLIKQASTSIYSDIKFFSLSNEVTSALNKLRNEKLKHIDESKESEDVREYNEIIGAVREIKKDPKDES